MARETCRVDNGNLTPVLDLGEQYLSDFRADDEKPPKYPLEIAMCDDCKLVQLTDTTPPYEMYHDRYGFKSGVNEAIRGNLAEIVDEALTWKRKPKTWLDIASNDGTLLSNIPENVYRVGIDPITKYCLEAEQHADRIINDFFKPEYFTEQMRTGVGLVNAPTNKFDVITSISMFYDLDDPNEFVEGVKSVLAKGGVWSVQQNYLLTTMELNAADNICHEHLEYYSLLALENLLARHGLEVFDCSTNMINGGSIRTLIQHAGERPVQESVLAQRQKEADFGIADPSKYIEFGEQVQQRLKKLADFVIKEANDGKQTYIYGASTRGGTIWQGAGLDVEHLPKAVERNPEKVGKKIASIGVPIISEEQARAEHPDYMLVSPWFFKDVFVDREKEYLESGGKFVFPLPEVEIVWIENGELVSKQL